LAGSWRVADGAEGRTLLLLHGFAEDRRALLSRAEEVGAAGWNIVLVDARGRGRSEGEWTSFGGREAADVGAWVDAVRERVGPSLRLAVWGRSMGAAIALRAATEDDRIAAVVLEAPYPDLAITVASWLRRLRLPGVFAKPILSRAGQLAGVSLEYPRPIELAPKAAQPVLIIHGAEDSIVASASVRHMADAFPTPPIVIEVPRARHRDIVDVGGTELFAQITAFLVTAIESKSCSK
jgi:pimeloyl-ACP methyl ester carboxylesterase